MWTPEFASGSEAAKTRHRVISLLRGRGLDLGCGDEKIVKSAIGIDVTGAAKDLVIDLAANNALSMFADCSMDYVFASHCLTEFMRPEVMLKEWWRVVAVGGHVILYDRDPEFCPRANTAGAEHRTDVTLDCAKKILKGLGNAVIVSESRHGESNEYSWLLVVRKSDGRVRKPLDILDPRRWFGRRVIVDGKRPGQKTCLVIRYGALGDTMWVTPVLKQLKAEGYYVVYNCTDYSAQVLRECPWIDEYVVQDKDAIQGEQLAEFWKRLGEGFDRVINLSGSVEGAIVKPEYAISSTVKKSERHHECNVNFQDATMAAAGYPKLKGKRPILHFTDDEERGAQILMANAKDKFVVLWSLAGSSFHKVYPWAEYVAGEIYRNHKDTVIITVGDEACRILEWELPNTRKASGLFTVRQSMIMTKYANLVIGSDTGILNAASAFDTPKIVFLSSSSTENLTKYWTNVQPLFSKRCKCYPCHKLIYTDSCPKGEIANAPLCMEQIEPKAVYDAFLKVYREWKNGQRQVAETGSGTDPRS